MVLLPLPVIDSCLLRCDERPLGLDSPFRLHFVLHGLDIWSM
jgi:hypothetical protein